MNAALGALRTIRKVLPGCVQQNNAEVSFWIARVLRTRRDMMVDHRGKWVTTRPSAAEHVTVVKRGTQVLVDHIAWKDGKYHFMTHSTPMDHLGNKPTDISCFWQADGSLRGALVEALPIQGGRRPAPKEGCRCPVCLGVASVWTMLLVGAGVFMVSRKWWWALLSVVGGFGLGWWVTRNPLGMLDVEE